MNSQNSSSKHLTVFGYIVGGLCLVVVLAFIVVATWLIGLPDYSNIKSYANTGITTIYASDKETVLAKLYLENRIEVSREEVADYVFDGTVATEDERFFEHGGIDPIGIARALVVNASSGGASEGASTITQQLVRNTVLLDEMSDISIKRKIREMYIASQAEHQYSKDEILLMYVNVINYGDGCYGIEAASRDYFGKHASELTLSEATLLIGIPQSPNANNPRNNMSNAMARRATVLQRMLTNGYITQEEYDAALADTPKLAPKTTTDDSISDIAPYFVDYIRNLLSNDERFPASSVAHGGLAVYTTLDPVLQKDAIDAIDKHLNSNDPNFDASLVSIEPDSGAVVAMVGGRDYTTSKFNLATQMSRQAGSSFKTFTLLSALNEGLNPDSTYIDSSSPIQIGSDWTVSNSEGHGKGTMSVTNATIASVNTVYAQLVHAIGVDKTIQMARDCGITSKLVEDDTVSLGTSGVNPLEMASAYGTIANGGYYYEPYAITEIIDPSGKTVYEHETPAAKRVLSAAVAQKATEILEYVVTSGTGTAANLSNGQPCAGKTGTSEHGRDLWFCGFTPQYSTAVWAGYREERATSLYGGSICAPIWRDYMDAALKDQSIVEFPVTSEKINYKPSKTWDFTTDITIIGGDEAPDPVQDPDKPKDDDPNKPKDDDPNKPKDDPNNPGGTTSGDTAGGAGTGDITPIQPTPEPTPTAPTSPTP